MLGVHGVRGADEDRVEAFVLEQTFYRGIDGTDLEALGHQLGLRPVVIADGDDLNAVLFAEKRDVNELRDSTATDDPNLYRIFLGHLEHPGSQPFR